MFKSHSSSYESQFKNVDIYKPNQLDHFDDNKDTSHMETTA